MNGHRATHRVYLLVCLCSWRSRSGADTQLQHKTSMTSERRRREEDGKGSASDEQGAAGSCRTSAGRAVRLRLFFSNMHSVCDSTYEGVFIILLCVSRVRIVKNSH